MQKRSGHVVGGDLICVGGGILYLIKIVFKNLYTSRGGTKTFVYIFDFIMQMFVIENYKIFFNIAY